MQTDCPTCHAPTRVLYAPGQRPPLTPLVTGTWIDLEQCGACGALWCMSPYEPYAAFEYVARWPFDQATWEQQHAVDDGQTLRHWHAAMIREHWEALPPPERAKVEYHRQRSSGHNPIDNRAVFGALSVSALLRQMQPPPAP